MYFLQEYDFCLIISYCNVSAVVKFYYHLKMHKTYYILYQPRSRLWKYDLNMKTNLLTFSCRLLYRNCLLYTSIVLCTVGICYNRILYSSHLNKYVINLFLLFPEFTIRFLLCMFFFSFCIGFGNKSTSHRQFTVTLYVTWCARACVRVSVFINDSDIYSQITN